MTFNPTQFKQDYPQFVNIADGTLTNIYNYNALPNSEWVKLYTVWDDATKHYWTCIVLAHILTTMYGVSGAGGGSALDGRISQATTGDVTVQTEYATPRDSTEANWNTTIYGQQVYKMMMALPTLDYVC